MATLLFFVILSISVSFLCSILEAALLSLTPSYIAQQKISNPKLYERLKLLKDKIDQPLAAILTLNTVAHTVGAAGVGSQVTVIFGDGYLAITSAVMTFLILTLSEILPKTIGSRYWKKIAPALPLLLGGMIILLKPFIWLSDQIMKMFGGTAPDHNIRQEIKALALLGRELNSLDEDEQRAISNIIDLHDVKVKDIMTPRTVCKKVKPTDSLESFVERLKEEQFSRYPVVDEEEAPLGIAFRYDMLHITDQKTIADLMKPANVVSDQLNVEQLMTRFMRERQHMCLVYDEYGTWQGIVTMEDVIEAIIGKPIMDETDDIPNMRRHARRKWANKLKHLPD